MSGIQFIASQDWPKAATITESNIETFLSNYTPELEWAVDELNRSFGYSISMPQIGVPFNAVLIRVTTSEQPSLIYNLKYIPDRTKVLRASIETEYGKGTRIINRYSKITAYWETYEDKKFTKNSKVMRWPKHSTNRILTAVFQAAADIVNDNR